MAFTRTWDAAYEALPTDANYMYEVDDYIRQDRVDVRERMEIDHIWKVGATDGLHKRVTLQQLAKPTNAADTFFIYAKDASGKIELYFLDEDGNDLQVTSAGALYNVVYKTLFDANTILAANADNTPAAVTVAEQRIVGRITGGNIAALTGAQILTILNSTASRILGQKSSGDTTALTAAEVRTILATAPFVVGSDADGDMWYRASGALARLAKGTQYQVLRMNSGATAPEWAAEQNLNCPPTLVSICTTSDHYWQSMETSYATITSIKVYIPTGATYCRFSVYMQAAGSTGYFRLNIGALNSAGVSVASGVWQWKDVGSAFDISSVAGTLVTLNLQGYNNVGDPQTIDFGRLIVYLCSS